METIRLGDFSSFESVPLEFEMETERDEDGTITMRVPDYDQHGLIKEEIQELLAERFREYLKAAQDWVDEGASQGDYSRSITEYLNGVASK